jgi:hypothetical protein
VAYPNDLVLVVRHGSVTASDFFIQSPDRTCADPPAASYTLARYAVSSGVGPGMAADFFVCVRTSFGTWLRYDVLAGDGSDNPDIGWDVPVGAELLTDGGDAGSLTSDGYARYVATEPGTHAVLRASHAAGNLSDTIDIFFDPQAADTLSVTSPNTGASASAACTALPAAPPGSGSVESCLISNQAEQVRILASGPGIPAPVDVSSDGWIVLGIVPGAATCGVDFAAGRERIVTAGAPAGTGGICGTSLRAVLDAASVPAGSVTPATWDLAVLTGPYGKLTRPPPLTLNGVGGLASIETSGVASTYAGPVTIETSWWSAGWPGAASPIGLVTDDPAVARPLTSRYWTPGFAPLGVVAGGTDLARPGTPYFAMLAGGVIPSTSSAIIKVWVPGFDMSVGTLVTTIP